MKQHNSLPSLTLGVAWLLLLTACGGGGDGPRVRDEAQQIALETPPRLLVGGTASLSAIASSGLPVSYASLSPQSCQVEASSGLVQSLAAAPCVIGISQSGNASWAPAPSQQITLQPEAVTQSLSFAAAPVLRAGGNASLSATASSGLAVRYSSLSPEVCSVEAESGRLLGLQAGNCRIAADQAGDARWSPAPQALLQLEVLPDPQQRISFGPAPTLTLGSQARVSATASSGLPVRYSSLSASVCSVEASSGQVQSLSLGDCVIAADQAGDALHEPAPQLGIVLVTREPERRVQSISFSALPVLTVGAQAQLRASASSGLSVRYSSLRAAVCSVDASTGLVRSLSLGDCVIQADQAGDQVYAAAAPVRAQLSTLAAPEPERRTQTLSFGAAPALRVGMQARVLAAASSGLTPSYSSLSASVCSADGSGLVTGLGVGTCRIAANQAGDARWLAAAQSVLSFEVGPDPAQSISFSAMPVLTLGGTASVRATASSGLPVRYTSLSPAVCSINAGSGLITSLALGDCLIAADQPGNGVYNAATQVRVALSTQPGASPPGPPQGVSARLGGDVRSVLISLGAVDSGGSPISAYSVQSQPAGITASGSSLPLRVSCPASCAGYRFTVAAVNARGAGPASAAAEVITEFDITTVFREPDTQPRDTIFIGRITLNSSTGQLSGLKGVLTESMTGAALGSAPLYDMVQVPLNYQLKSWSDAALGGSFAASFAKNSISTFATLGGGDGWSPAAGVAVGGVYAGFPASYAGTVKNSYVLVFVPQDPFAPLTPAQLAKLAYADCAPGGMMGATCMTGTSVAGYGALGTMSGYPLSQTLSPR